VADRIAIDLLRIARNPATGRLRHTSSLEAALRGALFAEMAFDGYLVDESNAPSTTLAEPTDDRVFELIWQAVRERPNVAWRRWFRWVKGDRTAMCRELVEAQRWVPKPGRRTAFTDVESDQALAMSIELNRIAAFERSPKDSREAVLVLLGVACGAVGPRPRPSAVRRELKLVLASVDNATAAKVVTTAAAVIRRRRLGLGSGH
jgi:hypothetical protein